VVDDARERLRLGDKNEEDREPCLRHMAWRIKNEQRAKLEPTSGAALLIDPKKRRQGIEARQGGRGAGLQQRRLCKGTGRSVKATWEGADPETMRYLLEHCNSAVPNKIMCQNLPGLVATPNGKKDTDLPVLVDVSFIWCRTVSEAERVP
jgi:hypothetical protein